MAKILIAVLVVVLTSIGILFSCKRDCDNCGFNMPPVARAGSDLIVTLPNVNIVLDGSYSKDDDGKIVKWLWTKISGPDPCEIVTKDSAITSVKNVIAGLYQFQLEVTDNGGQLAKDTVLLTVLAENHPPIAVAGADVSIALPSCSARGTTTLDGSASSDPDNDIVNYLWRKISGPSARLMAITTRSLKVEDMFAGTYSFELTVLDSKGLTAKDTVVIQVTQPMPQQYDIDIATSIAYLFHNNVEECYYYYYGCYFYDLLEAGGKVNLSPSEVFNIQLSDYSDSSRTVYADYSHLSLFSEASQKNVYGICSVNFKKLMQDGGGPFTGTLKITGGNADQCVPNILSTVPMLTVSGAMDTTAKRLTLAIKGKIYF